MRTLIISLAMALGVFGSAYADGERVTTDIRELPSAAQGFLKRHFSTLPVHGITIWNENGANNYSVTMVGGSTIHFNQRGEWTTVDCYKTAAPESIPPTKVINFVRNSYPQDYITAIKRDDSGGYDIRLVNGNELKFNSRGDYQRIN